MGSIGYGVSLNFKNVVMLELSRFCSNEFLQKLEGAAPPPLRFSKRSNFEQMPHSPNLLRAVLKYTWKHKIQLKISNYM